MPASHPTSQRGQVGGDQVTAVKTSIQLREKYYCLARLLWLIGFATRCTLLPRTASAWCGSHEETPAVRVSCGVRQQKDLSLCAATHCNIERIDADWLAGCCSSCIRCAPPRKSSLAKEFRAVFFFFFLFSNSFTHPIIASLAVECVGRDFRRGSLSMREISHLPMRLTCIISID